MKKIIKILFIVFILLVAYNYFFNVYASGVNMNLPNNDTTTYGTTSTNTGTNTGTTTGTTNTPLQSSSAAVSNPSASSLDALTLSDMIDIVLCAIGVILILLGIAIIIRQKSV